jgi:hypothetical protein
MPVRLNDCPSGQYITLAVGAQVSQQWGFRSKYSNEGKKASRGEGNPQMG